ncbi:MAG: CRISPR-associated protein Cas4 [Deltaproteobacteria bacterium]|nr:CRISPR-associated protein Cas4 [Deltaproteobacteria bacterium]
MSYSEDELISISALAHYSYCPRRCALIHIEQAWEENLFTAQGRLMHERAHSETRETRGNITTARGLPLRSLRLGLVDKADVVEFHRQPASVAQPFPVEYKRGKPKVESCDKIQLCAQAMCLEEMLNVAVLDGAIFYGTTNRRFDVAFDDLLRRETEETARATHALLDAGVTPPPEHRKSCESCSLLHGCFPKALRPGRSAVAYINTIWDSL